MNENKDCGECNDTGIIGYPPDQYSQCPDCGGPSGRSERAPATQMKVETTVDTTEVLNLLKQMRLNSHDHAVFSQLEDEIITRMAAGHAAARAAGLEEAALVCDSLGGEIDERNVDEVKLCANSLAWHIRRLAGQPAESNSSEQEFPPLPETTLTADVAGYTVKVYGVQHMREYVLADRGARARGAATPGEPILQRAIGTCDVRSMTCFTAAMSADEVVRRVAAAPAPQVPAGQDAEFQAAVDAEYPMPDNPHASVITRATDNRAAMWRGINAARKILVAPAQRGQFGIPLPIKYVPMVGWTLTEAYQQGWRDARAASRVAPGMPVAARLDDNDRESIVSAIRQLDELSTGTIAALGSNNLLKNGGPKKATMADVKRVLPYIVRNLRGVVLKLDGGVA